MLVVAAVKNKVYIHEVINSICMVIESFKQKCIWILLCGINVIPQEERKGTAFQAMNNKAEVTKTLRYWEGVWNDDKM